MTAPQQPTAPQQGTNLITLCVGPPGAGKTTWGIRDAQAHGPFVWILPSKVQANPLAKTVPWVSELGFFKSMALSKGRYSFIYAPPPNGEILPDTFGGGGWPGYTFVLDDYPALMLDPRRAARVEQFLVGIRHRGGRATILTHRLKKSVSPLVRDLADRVVLVGPIRGRETGDALYDMADEEPESRQEFRQRLSANPKYNPALLRNDFI